MKKSILFMSAVAMLAAASCNKPELENVGTTPEVGANEFVAYTESATKTTLNGYTTVWEAGDQIAINEVAYMTSEGGERAIFTLNDENEPEAPYLAGYPYTNVMASEGTAIEFAYLDMENELILTRNHIGDEVFAMAYNESDRSLEFKNVVSLLKFQVPSTFAEEITSITISTNEPLAGYFTAEYNGGEPTWEISEGDTSVKEIILKDEQRTFSSEATYFVPVLPGDKTNLTVKLNETVVATGISMKFERNMIHNVEVLPSAEVRKVYLKPEIWAADNPWFAAHFFNANDGFKDVPMTDSDEDGIYEVVVPNGATSVIFCRMNPAFTEFSWDEGHVWTQTQNLTVPAVDAAEIYYVVEGWDAGSWKTYEDATAEPEVDASAYGLVGSFQGWDPANPIAMEYVSDGWIVARNVELYKDDAFKFLNGKTWDDVNYGASSVLEDGVPAKAVKGGSDIMVGKNGIHDLYLNPNAEEVKAICVTEYTDLTVNITIDNKANWSPLYIHLEKDGVSITPANGVLVNGSTYAVSGKYIGETLKCKFTSGTNESKVEDVSITKTGGNVSVESKEDTKPKLYLVPNANWKKDNARFAAYFFGNGEKWVSMTNVNGKYECEIPTGFPNVIFCRMNPSASANNWNNKWNQTEDLVIPTNGNNTYTVKANTWDKGGGTWSKTE